MHTANQYALQKFGYNFYFGMSSHCASLCCGVSVTNEVDSEYIDLAKHKRELLIVMIDPKGKIGFLFCIRNSKNGSIVGM